MADRKISSRRIPIEELLNKKFGRLTIISEAKPHQQPNGDIQRLFSCLCDCGNKTIARLSNLRSGNSRSCGCYNREMTSKTNTIHQKSQTRLYVIWSSMKARCSNPKNISYKYYGGKGVKVCDEWQNNFQSFYDWSMENGYKAGLTIDRKESDGNYELSNCQWISTKENTQKTSRIKLSMELAQEIRNIYSSGHTTQRELAGVYDISQRNILDIIKNRIWL